MLSLILCLLFLFTPSSPASTAAEQPFYYAKIESENVCFYSSPIDLEENKTFELPSSYFVKLSGSENDDFYTCSYGELNGYIKKTQVVPMEGVPKQPYVNFANFRVFALEGLDFRSSPYKTPFNVLTKVPCLEENLVYFGRKEGDELIPNKSKTWYYCKYESDKTYFGYLNSSFCDDLTPIPLNFESFKIIANPIFQNQNPPTSPSAKMSGTVKTLIILGVSLPSVVIIYLLIKPTLMNEKKTTKAKSSKRKSHRSDYFEYNENDLT